MGGNWPKKSGERNATARKLLIGAIRLSAAHDVSIKCVIELVDRNAKARGRRTFHVLGKDGAIGRSFKLGNFSRTAVPAETPSRNSANFMQIWIVLAKIILTTRV
jgi:hypothetical protein